MPTNPNPPTSHPLAATMTRSGNGMESRKLSHLWWELTRQNLQCAAHVFLELQTAKIFWLVRNVWSRYTPNARSTNTNGKMETSPMFTRMLYSCHMVAPPRRPLVPVCPLIRRRRRSRILARSSLLLAPDWQNLFTIVLLSIVLSPHKWVTTNYIINNIIIIFFANSHRLLLTQQFAIGNLWLQWCPMTVGPRIQCNYLAATNPSVPCAVPGLASSPCVSTVKTSWNQFHIWPYLLLCIHVYIVPCSMRPYN